MLLCASGAMLLVHATYAVEEILVMRLEVGSILASDIYNGDTLIVRSGTVVTEALLRTLTNMGIVNELDVLSSVNSLTNQARIGLLTLDIDQIVHCAETLVDDLVSGEFNSILHLVYDYDLCTFTHSRNVTLLALLSAIELQYPVSDMKTLAIGALLHDIGKLQIPESILKKPGRLTEREFSIMKNHPIYGYKMVEGVSKISPSVRKIILQHHENYDGSGYPKALDGDHGYRLAMLVHICDVYEAMCARRPYKKPIPRDDVREFMLANCNSMFDPVLVKKFLFAVPEYLIGEELLIDGVPCLVVKTDLNNDPIIQTSDYTGRLSEFRSIVGAAS